MISSIREVVLEQQTARRYPRVPGEGERFDDLKYFQARLTRFSRVCRMHLRCMKLRISLFVEQE